ncbi:MAG: hypothetical protein QOI11_2606, partial [Candidatus Eremiobacteraeota bacterium]|nr:hypothetical protein [Candidatus Eremiobacteraeota bacterium]
SSMILLFGAEFTRVYAEKHGSLASQHAASDGDPKTRGATPSTAQGATVATGAGDAGDAGAAQPGDAASGSQTAKSAPSVRGESDGSDGGEARADAPPAKPHPAGRPLT